LITDQVVEAVSAVGVDEAVANPAASAYAVNQLVFVVNVVGRTKLTSH
jgi:hypothetical protein